MKISAVIRINLSPALTKANFKKLKAMVTHREFSAPSAIQAAYVLPSAEFEKLYQAAKSVGMSMWVDHESDRRDDEFKIEGRMEFEESDLAECRYAQADCTHNFNQCDTEETDRPPRFTLPLTEFNVDEIEHATRDHLYAGKLHMAASVQFYLVSDHFKKCFEEAGFRGADFIDGFRPTGKFARQVKGKYWLFVPRKKVKMADDDQGFLKQVRKLVSDKAVAAQVAKHLWINMLDGKSVARQESFEVAQTAGAERGTGIIIGTEKFRAFCREAGAEITWQPLPICSE